MAPVMLVARHRRNDEHERCHHNGDAECPCDVESPEERNQAQQVAEQDEKENRQQERRVPFRLLLSDTGNRHFVPNEQDKGLEEILQSGGCLPFPRRVGAPCLSEQEQDEAHHEQHAEHTLRDGKVNDGHRTMIMTCVGVLVMVTMTAWFVVICLEHARLMIERVPQP